jgi:putative FmdB family regulatory protein
MPIYAYRCESCGFEKDILQKISDAPLTQCPTCSKHSFCKQVTAAGFQLKGSGWYVTDFRGGTNNAKASAAASDESAKADDGKPQAASSDSVAKPVSGSTASASSSTDAAAPAANSTQA